MQHVPENKRLDARQTKGSQAPVCVITRIQPNGPATGHDETFGGSVILPRSLWAERLVIECGSVVTYEVETTYGGHRIAGRILSVEKGTTV